MGNDAELENELMGLSSAKIKRRIDDMEEILNNPSWSLELKLSADAYLPMLQLELAQRGVSHGEN